MLLVKNGIIVTESGRRLADILCEGEKILEIREGIRESPGAEVIDASGKYVFPGFIDPHVHAYLPLPTTCSKDNYETTGVAALMGGTTCIIDFCSPERHQRPLEAWEIWNQQSVGRATCDYGYHLAVTRFDESVVSEIRELIRLGITSFKIYLAYKQTVALPWDQLERLLAFAAREGILVLAHCEDPDDIEALQKRLLAEGKTGPEWHYHSRPPEIEAKGTRRFLEMAREKSALAYVVHLSCREALDAALAVGTVGKSAWIETLISFLVLDRTYAERPNFEGAKYIVSPPLRDRKNQDVLWRALADGRISTVATDHAPFDFETQKKMGLHDFTKIPNGMPTVEHRIEVLYTHGVLAGRISLEQMVRVAATYPAKLFGLYPRKGTIAPGADADLVVFDPKAERMISARNHHMNVDYNPFEGWRVQGRADVVILRGRVVCRDGHFVGRPGYGQYIPRGHSIAV